MLHCQPLPSNQRFLCPCPCPSMRSDVHPGAFPVTSISFSAISSVLVPWGLFLVYQAMHPIAYQISQGSPCAGICTFP